MDKYAELIFLGTGTSQGVPIIGCSCQVCSSEYSKNKRLRTSVFIQSAQASIVIDAGPDFRYQLIREKISDLDAILITHPHRDHMGGLDDVRPFNYYQNQPMPLYATAFTMHHLKECIPYAFMDHPYPGAPQFYTHEIENNGPSFKIKDLQIQAIDIMHYQMHISAFRIGNLTYITDANFISEESLKKIEGSEILIVNALRRETHLAHFTLAQALDLVKRIKPQKTYFTHISHDLEHKQVSAELPSQVYLAYDGLKIPFKI